MSDTCFRNEKRRYYLNLKVRRKYVKWHKANNKEPEIALPGESDFTLHKNTLVMGNCFGKRLKGPQSEVSERPRTS